MHHDKIFVHVLTNKHIKSLKQTKFLVLYDLYREKSTKYNKKDFYHLFDL
jgi:hypothetical protein